MQSDKIFILGNGAFGSALAATLRVPVLLWGRSPWRFFVEQVKSTQDLNEAFSWSSSGILAIPVQHLREFILGAQKNGLHEKVRHLLLACKGMEKDTGFLPTEILQDVGFSGCIGVFSGPNLASEMIKGHFSSAVIGCKDAAVSMTFKNSFKSENCKISTSQDVIGLQLAGALKNVMAIGYGFLEYLENQSIENQGESFENLKAAYLTLALQEMITLGHAFSASLETFLTVAGIGDLWLTATSKKSRNASFGRSFFPKRQFPSFLVEGYATLTAVLNRANSLNVFCPLMKNIQSLLNGDLEISSWPKIILSLL